MKCTSVFFIGLGTFNMIIFILQSLIVDITVLYNLIKLSSGVGTLISTYRVMVMVFNATFNIIVTVSSIGGGSWSYRRKQTTCHKSLTTLSHNRVSSTPLHEQDSNSQRLL